MITELRIAHDMVDELKSILSPYFVNEHDIKRCALACLDKSIMQIHPDEWWGEVSRRLATLPLECDIPKKETIMNVISAYYDIPVERIMIKTRKRIVYEPRAVAMAIIYAATDTSNHKIEDETGFDHATVINARKSVRNLYQSNAIFKAKVDGILRCIIGHDGTRKDVIKKMLTVGVYEF